MINGLTGGQYIKTSGGSVGGPYISAETPIPALAKGAVRFNNARFEVWDGSYWTQIYGDYGSVSLAPDAIEAINWVREKIEMEKKIEKLAEESSAVANAWAEAKDALDKLQVIITLSEKPRDQK